MTVDVDKVTSFIHLVNISVNREFLFNLNNINLAVGDLILFRFLKLNYIII